MTGNQKTIVSLALVQLKDRDRVDEAEIRRFTDLFRIPNPVTDEEAEEVVNELRTRLSVRMDPGVCLKEKKHVSWYYAAKRTIVPRYWARYRLYLSDRMGLYGIVIHSLDSALDEMILMLVNPGTETDLSRS